jgi:hypothetical protein
VLVVTDQLFELFLLRREPRMGCVRARDDFLELGKLVLQFPELGLLLQIEGVLTYEFLISASLGPGAAVGS